MKQFDVVISGVSGRFPDCDNVDTFKKKLYDGENFISFDERKWKSSITYEFGKQTIPQGTGKFTQVKDFDAMIFRINHLLARSNDIINRKVLEPAFEALVDAGINPYTLAGANIGVFTSYGINENDRTVYEIDPEILQMIGVNKTMMANRISFGFDLKGPSLVYAGDIFGTLAAFAAGYESVAKGYLDAAIVGVCSSFLEPLMSLNYFKMNFLSADSYTRVFSSDASGFARSEGCVLFYLQRAEEAKRIYAYVNLCETYYSGNRTGTLLQYDEKYVSTFFETVYQKSFVKPSDLSFVEMSACALKKLDSIESNVVEEIFCKNRESPLLVGSIKSNVGHAEAAAPFMSILKGILALETNTIAPNIHLKEIDKDIKPLDRGTLQVVSTLTTLPGDTIGVNVISYSGEVGHTVLRRNDKKQNELLSDNLPRLLLICGRAETALTSVIEQVESKPFDHEFIALANDVFSIDMPSHSYRGYTILPKPSKSINDVKLGSDQSRPIWYLYTGMGSQWNCMGHGLLELPIFADVVKRCDAVLKPCGIDIYEVLTSDDPVIFDNIINSFVGIITVQIGLTEILKAIGLAPDGIIGHSVGEIGCAYADGCLTLEEAVMSSYARGVSSTEIETVKGMMAAVGKGYNELKESIPANIEIACRNSSFSCTLSGPAEDVETFVNELKQQKIFAKTVNVANIAYHSKYIAAAGPALITRLEKIIKSPKQRSSKWISTSVDQDKWDESLAKYCSAEYMTNNLLSPVLFEEGCQHIPKNAIVIEIAPHGLLQAIVKKSLPETCVNIPLTKRCETKDNLRFLLSSLGQLYIAGCSINVNKLFPEVFYPVSPGTLPVSSLCTWDHIVINSHNRFLDAKQRDPLWDDLIHILLNDGSEYTYLNHHKLNNDIIIPSGFYIYLTWWIVSVVECKKLETVRVLFEDVKFHEIVKISHKKPRSFSVMIQASGSFEVLLANKEDPKKRIVVASGQVSTQAQKLRILKLGQINLPPKLKVKINGKLFFNLLAQYGYHLDECFSNVNELCYTEPEYYSTVPWCQNWVTFLDSLMKIQMLPHMQKEKATLYPSFVRRLLIYNPKNIVQSEDSITCHYDATDKILRCEGIEMFGLEFKRVPEKFSVQSYSKSNFKAYKFVEYSNPLCPDLRSFLKVCLQIIADNLALTLKNKNGKFCILRNPLSLENMKVIDKILKENDFLKTRTVFRSEKETAASMDSFECMLELVNHQYPKNGLNIDQLFLILILHACQQIPRDMEKHFVQVLKQSFGTKTLILYKKKLANDDLSRSVVTEIDHSRINDFKLSNIPRNTIIARNNIEIEDISSILNDKQKYDSKFLFVMDHENSSMQKDTFLNERLSNLSLPVSVLKNGQLGFYKDVTEETINNRKSNKDEASDLFSDAVSLDEASVLYFRAEPFINKDEEFKFFEYIGTHVSGKRIIGITSASLHEPQSQIYSNFTWTIPETWTLNDEPLVSATFLQAYNILKLKKSEGPLDTMLINMGKEYSLTEACILVALELKVTVYVATLDTVASEAIKKIFPQINEDHILCSSNCIYETQILTLTRGKGVDMIINCASGLRNIDASLNCVSKFGVVVQVADESDCSDLNKLGLISFLKSVSFYMVPHNMRTLFKLHPEDQKFLKTCMQEGIDSGTVKPFSKVWKGLEKDKLLRLSGLVKKNKPENSLQCCKLEKLQFGSSYSYIIVGNETNSSWFTFLEWLISKGARKLILAVHNFTMSSNISQQLNTLISRNNITVILTTVQKIDSIKNANELIDEAAKIGPLEAVFFIHVDSANKKIYNVDKALRDRNLFAHLISLFSGGLKECEARRCHKFPAIVVHGEKSKNISSTFEKETNCFDPHNHLPTDLQGLENIGYSMTQKTKFKEMRSLNLPFHESRGVYPVFIIPAILGAQLQPLIKKLLYPVFCATLSESDGNATEIAACLFGELNKIQPTGPVTLIGETWSTCITIELSKLVTQSNRKCQMFLIDGNCNVWKKRLLNLGHPLSIQFDINFLKNVLNFSKITPETFVQLGTTFKHRLETYLSEFTSNNFNSDYVIRALMSLRHRLMVAAKYEMSEQSWNDTILFVQRYSEDQSMRLSVSSSMIIKQENDYEKFVQDAEIIRTINDNALFSWWDYTKIDNYSN